MAIAVNETVSVENDGPVAVVTINHPPANAINSQVIAGLQQALLDAESTADCRAVVITGAGSKFFAAGADIKEFASEGSGMVEKTAGFTLAMENSRLPIIAAVNGIAFGGGCEVAMACDIRIASTAARFAQPEIKLGIIPGWGGTQRLPRLVGQSVALELLLTGEPVDAQRVLEIGLVSRVVPGESLLEEAKRLASTLAAQAPLAVAAIKGAVYRGAALPLSEALELELEEFLNIFGSDDATEGIKAFVEKRNPVWKGR